MKDCACLQMQTDYYSLNLLTKDGSSVLVCCVQSTVMLQFCFGVSQLFNVLCFTLLIYCCLEKTMWHKMTPVVLAVLFLNLSTASGYQVNKYQPRVRQLQAV